MGAPERGEVGRQNGRAVYPNRGPITAARRGQGIRWRKGVARPRQSRTVRIESGAIHPAEGRAQNHRKRGGTVANRAWADVTGNEQQRESGRMAYYVIFDVTIRDLPKYQEYMVKIKPVIESAGGRYLVRGGQHMVIEGDWKPTRLVIFEFPSLAAAQSFYVSPAYQSLKALRQEASSANIVGVEGA
jgi:uncharacterized protein (DUF1330 family)